MQNESISRQTFVKGVAAVAVTAASLGILQYQKYPDTENFTASATGMESDVSVTLVMDGQVIKDVQVDVSGETDGIGAAIGDEVRQQILDAQSADIDGVAGASVTSEAVRQATRAALQQAGIEVPEPETAAQTEAAEPAEAGTEAAAPADAQEDAAEGTTENTADSTAPSAGAETADSSTYSASAPGISSDVTVTLTVEDGTITAATADVSGETPGIGADIEETVVQQILDAQSADIDGVAGATITSDAVRTAAAEALAQAGLGAEEADAAETEQAPEEAAITETEVFEVETTVEIATEASTELVPTPETELPEFDLSSPVTATGYANGAAGLVKVTLTAAGGEITDAVVDVSGETLGSGSTLAQDAAQQILDTQSAEIDAVSGATITSNAVAKAAASALEKLAVLSPAGEDGIPAKCDYAPPVEDAKYVPGTYTGTAQGMDSEVTVTIQVDETYILDVQIDVSGETPGIGAAIGEEMAQALIEAQSSEIDAVTGATVTSTAISDAAADALAQAAVQE